MPVISYKLELNIQNIKFEKQPVFLFSRQIQVSLLNTFPLKKRHFFKSEFQVICFTELIFSSLKQLYAEKKAKN